MIFTDGSVILCGWEPRKRRQRQQQRGGLYGIGGKVEPGDRGDYRLTAARETLEELFGLGTPVPIELTLAVAALPVVRTEMVERYVIIHRDFTALRAILRLVRLCPSPLYPRGIPQTLEGLLLERRCDRTGVEMAQLCLLPVVGGRIHISSELVDDIRRLAAAAKHRTPLENGQQQLQPAGSAAAAGTGSPRSIGSATAPACSHD